MVCIVVILPIAVPVWVVIVVVVVVVVVVGCDVSLPVFGLIEIPHVNDQVCPTALIGGPELFDCSNVCCCLDVVIHTALVDSELLAERCDRFATRPRTRNRTQDGIHRRSDTRRLIKHKVGVD